MKLKNRIAVLFNVSDINRTAHFYRTILGLEVELQPGDDEPDWLMAKLSNDIELLFFEGKEEIGRSPIVVFELEEGYIESAVENLAKEGAEIVTPVTEAPGGWSADFKDPDGHPLAFYQTGDLPLRKE